jgi:hypothetical protein
MDAMRIVEDGPGRVLLIMSDNAAFFCHKTRKITCEPVPFSSRNARARKRFRFAALFGAGKPAIIR